MLYKPVEIFEATDSDTAVALIKQRAYDLILMDVHVPKSDMLGLMEYINDGYPDAKVLIFSMSAENVYAKRFLKAGAKGFLSKEAGAEETIKAMNLVINGRKYISDTLAEMLAENSLANSPVNPFDKLSSREFKIATMMLQGLSLSDIAKSLNLQPSTVGTHKAKVFTKLAISNLLELKEMANAFLKS